MEISATEYVWSFLLEGKGEQKKRQICILRKLFNLTSSSTQKKSMYTSEILSLKSFIHSKRETIS